MHWRRKWQTTPVFLPGEPHGQRSLVGYIGSQKVGHDRSALTQQQQPLIAGFLHALDWIYSDPMKSTLPEELISVPAPPQFT